jgi:hypothetical protein
MPKVLLFLIILLKTTIAQADCIMGSISCWPTKSTINRNSLIIIECYGYNQKDVSKLSNPNQVFLKSGNEMAYLKILEIHKGEFEITQIILQPEKPLTPGKEYELRIVLNKEQSISRYNPDTRKYEPTKWKVNNQIDKVRPEWISMPVISSTTIKVYGCGPEKWVNFNFASSDSSNLLVKATVRSIKTNTQTVYFIESDNHQIKIGHGMCSGAFHFDKGDEYEVVFTLVDESGNFSKQASKPIRFNQPLETY